MCVPCFRFSRHTESAVFCDDDDDDDDDDDVSWTSI
jgi:hypothetical protein